MGTNTPHYTEQHVTSRLQKKGIMAYTNHWSNHVLTLKSLKFNKFVKVAENATRVEEKLYIIKIMSASFK